MKNINTYIVEKYKISKNSTTKYTLFCDELCLNSKKDSARELFEYYENDCENVIGDHITEDQRYATDFELIFMLAVMLLDDGYNWKMLQNIGYKGYPGKNNPYDYSWFEEENEDGDDVLTILKDLYDEDNIDGEKFSEMFDNVMEKIEDCCADTSKAISGIWGLNNELEM